MINKAGIVLLTILLFPQITISGSIEYPDKFLLLEILNKGNYESADAIFSSYQKAYEAGDKEDIISFVFATFANSSPDLEKRLNSWVDKVPKSYAAKLARGIYYWNLANLSRGERYIQDTRKEQIQGMRSYFHKSRKDLLAALKINPKLTAAYSYLMSIEMRQGDRRSIDALLERALKVDPASFVIRGLYMFTLQPKWGGSLKQMRDFANRSNRYLSRNPKLDILHGYSHYVIADKLRRNGNRKKAKEFYDQALRYGDYWWFLYERGVNNYLLGDYNNALSDLNKAIALSPQNNQILRWRSKVYQRQNKLDLALTDINTALRLDPLDPKQLKTRSFLYKQQEKYKLAIDDLDNALIFASSDANIWSQKGYIYLFKLKDNDKAEEAMLKAIELNSEYPYYWYNYGVALYNKMDCKTADAFDNYMKLCDSGKKCKKDLQSWVRQTLPHINAYCK